MLCDPYLVSFPFYTMCLFFKFIGFFIYLCIYDARHHAHPYILSTTVLSDKQFYQETLPEAVCCCLQTCLLLIFIPLIEYIYAYKVVFT